MPKPRKKQSKNKLKTKKKTQQEETKPNDCKKNLLAGFPENEIIEILWQTLRKDITSQELEEEAAYQKMCTEKNKPYIPIYPITFKQFSQVVETYKKNKTIEKTQEHDINVLLDAFEWLDANASGNVEKGEFVEQLKKVINESEKTETSTTLKNNPKKNIKKNKKNNQKKRKKRINK
ncbi:hypothetical protein RFI_14430 [Reticulomyxa filosa]|uniref:EF-hand domain-containing protein n=1 Tax=Reticulomyxa filosa TaxID=46433 RepID=X6NAG6_RETFI|nr:hypothetical protein RFI_14430 [Reticulomyxa filosa]|eukprot:ETO22764.1 hypothetical protein RFI_14430 [Reticulomyxa filosa]